jgi:hypothetical protein
MRTTARLVINIFIGALGWIAFAAMWWIAFRNGAPSAATSGGTLLLVFVALVVLLDLAWVRHNVRLSNRFRRRVRTPARAVSYTRDVLGRALSGDPETLRDARAIVISASDETASPTKTYARTSEEMTDEEVGACSTPWPE